MDFGEAEFVNSRNLNKQLLIFRSERIDGAVYKFHKKTDNQYACGMCKRLGKSRVVTVVDGHIVGNKHPGDEHHPDCVPVSKESVDVTQLDREMRADVRKTGKRPRQAYTEAVCEISKRFKSSDEQETIISAFPSYPEVRGALYKHRAARHTPVPDPTDVPDQLRTTMRGKSVGPQDSKYQERFLLYSGQGGKLLVFAADTELETLHQSEYIICDGTFEMSPNSSYQLYTLHGMCRGEGMPLVWCLLPNKSLATYIELFTAIRQALMTRYEDGATKAHTFLTDFELAAMNAIKQVFVGSRLKGCTFHFRQALMKHVTDLGLRPAYSTDPIVQDWIRQIMGLTLLPQTMISGVWERMKHPPMVGDQMLLSKMTSFSHYFQSTWISGSYPTDVWCHFDNIGPRTTNLAEGWHSSLNHSFGMPHPSASSFLNWLQKCQYEVQCREIQLNAGRPAKQQSATYIDLNKKISDAKLQFGVRSGFMFVSMFPNPNMWDSIYAEAATYLRYVSYLIGQNTV